MSCVSFYVCRLLFFSGYSKEDNSFDLGKITESSRTKFAPEDGYQFQQLYENDDLPNYDRVEVGVGSLDFIDTSLVYTNTNIEDIDTQDLEQGIIDATLVNGPQNLYVKGFAQVDVLNASSNTITVSGFGPTIGQAFEADQLAIGLDIPQDNDALFGHIWATNENSTIKLIDHPESYTFPKDPFVPTANTTINEADLATFDDKHRINGVSLNEVDPTLFEAGILDAFALDGPQQVILYSYAHVDSASDKTAAFSSLGANIEKATGLSTIEVLIPTDNEHLFDGETTLSQIKAGDTVVIQLVLGYGENTLSGANVWLVDESGKVITQ